MRKLATGKYCCMQKTVSILDIAVKTALSPTLTGATLTSVSAPSAPSTGAF